MYIKKVLSIIIASTLAAGIFVGCGRKVPTADEAQQSAIQPQQSAANESAPAPADPTAIKIGYNPATGNLLAFIAEDKGYFAQENLSVEMVPFSSTSDGISAMNAGKIDVSFSFGTASPLTYIAQGSDITFIGGYLSGGHPIFTMPEKAGQFHSLTDYKGKSVATLRLYTSDIVWRNAMKKAGIDITKDLEVVEMKKPADIISAVRSGKVDVAIASSSAYTMGIESGLEVIGWSNELWPDHVCCRGIVRTAFYQESPDALTRLLRALLRAQRDFAADAEYAIALNAEKLDIDEAQSRNILYETNQNINLDPNTKGIVEMYNAMVEEQFLESEFDILSRIDTTLYKTALDDLIATESDAFFTEQLETYQRQNP